MADEATAFIEALQAGQVCLHPTDSLPGLAFDPRSTVAAEVLARIKGERPGKSHIGLVRDLAAACRFWQPLPPGWRGILDRFWPGPLSVIYTASPAAPPSLVLDGAIALRVPDLAEADRWLALVLEQVGDPLPSTSVNRSGNPPATDYRMATGFLRDQPDVFIPPRPFQRPPAAGKPSTLIRLTANGAWTCVRPGRVDPAEIQRCLQLNQYGENTE